MSDFNDRDDILAMLQIAASMQKIKDSGNKTRQAYKNIFRSGQCATYILGPTRNSTQ